MPPWDSRVPPPPPQRITWRNLEAGDMLLYAQALVALYRENLLERDEARDALRELGLARSDVETTPGEQTAELCGSCRVALDNLTTGMIVMEYNGQRMTLCSRCADNRLALGGRIIAQAKDIQG